MGPTWNTENPIWGLILSPFSISDGPHLRSDSVKMYCDKAALLTEYIVNDRVHLDGAKLVP